MSKFTDSIAHYLDGLHISTGSAASCPECCEAFGLDPDADTDENQAAIYESGDEGGFSWSQCDSCGTTLGGDRHTAHGWPVDQANDDIRSGEYTLFHLSICTDCLLFHANGDEPESWEPRP